MNILSYGAGTNSTALLVGLHERDIRPDYITFSDTGGEKPHTYEYIKIMQAWLKKVDFPEITIVKKVDKNGDVLTLEDDCLNTGTLPSIAYGFKKCSHKYKIQPQDKFFNNLPEAREVWKKGEKINKMIGFDAGEERRAGVRDDKKYMFSYPLIDWGWYREDCIEAINRAGLPNPGKSSCFFCPSSKKNEIFELNRKYPELALRALEIEEKAAPSLTSIKGLGRSFSWTDLLKQGDLFDAPEVIEPCSSCWDGSSTEDDED